ASDDAVGVGAVVLQTHAGGLVADEEVELVEAALVEEVLDPFPGGHLAPGVLAGDRLLRPGVNGLVAAAGQLGRALGQRVVHAATQATGATGGRVWRPSPPGGWRPAGWPGAPDPGPARPSGCRRRPPAPGRRPGGWPGRGRGRRGHARR